MMVTFWPLGVASEYSCRGCSPIGRSFSCVAPAIGRLMLANAPPVSPASHVHTRGGTYGSPVIWFRSWSCYRPGPGKSAGEEDLDYWFDVPRKLYVASSG